MPRKIADRYILFEGLDPRSPPSVHLAWDDRLLAFRALRWLEPDVREAAQITSRLNHPHVVTVHEFGEEQGKPYVVMELIAGGTLAERLTEGPLPPRAAVKVVDHVLRGLAAGHAHGVLHGGLDPSRVLLELDGTAKITDFGAPRTPADAAFFSSPEQKESPMTIGPAADLYAVGKLLTTLLIGPRPLDPHVAGNDDATETVMGNVDLALVRLVRKATMARPADRPTSAEAMRTQLARAAASLPPDPPGWPLILERHRKRARQWRRDRSQLLARRPEEVPRPVSPLERSLSLAAAIVLPAGMGCFGFAMLIAVAVLLSRCVGA